MSFTLRLTQKEEEVLEKLKVELKQSTYSGVIRELIANYPELLERYNNSLRKNGQLENDIRKIKKVTKDFITSWKEMNSLIE